MYSTTFLLVNDFICLSKAVAREIFVLMLGTDRCMDQRYRVWHGTDDCTEKGQLPHEMRSIHVMFSLVQ
jgi:hypothetical protein